MPKMTGLQLPIGAPLVTISSPPLGLMAEGAKARAETAEVAEALTGMTTIGGKMTTVVGANGTPRKPPRAGTGKNHGRERLHIGPRPAKRLASL